MRMKETFLKEGMRVWIDDDDDSGWYTISSINVAEDDCWLYGEDIGDDKRDMEQQFPLSWVERWWNAQN